MSEKNHPQGGYMRSLHKLEERLYSPELNLPGISMKVLLFIRHETLRWEEEETQITYSDIVFKTGISERRAKEAVKLLEKKGLIIVSRRTRGKKVMPNIIGLNPKFFGDLIEETCRPKMSVIEGGKSEKLSTGVREPAPSFTEKRTSVYRDPHPEHPLDPLPERQPGLLKNPLKEHNKKLLREIPDSFSFNCQEQEHKAKVLRQLDEMKRGLL